MILGNILFNGYFIADATAIVIMFGLIVLLHRRANNTPTIQWFKLYMIATIIMSLTMDMGQLFTNNAHKYELKFAVATFGICFLSISLYYFVFHFIGKEKILQQWWFAPLLWVPLTILLYFGWTHHAIFPDQDYSQVVLKPWGYVSTQASTSKVLPIISVLGIFVPILILYLSSFRSRALNFRREGRIIALGMALSLVTAVVSNTILPRYVLAPPLPIYGNMLLGIIVTFALLKYGSSAVDPAAIRDSIVKIMNSAAVALDADDRIMFANALATDLLGKSEQELTGKSIRSFIAKEQWAPFKEHVLANVSLSDKGNVLKSVVNSGHGKSITVNVYSSAYREKDGRRFGTILVLADIQLQEDLLKELAAEKDNVEKKVQERTRELHEEQSKLQAAIESLSLGFIMVDADDKIILSNHAVNTILGKQTAAVNLDGLNSHFDDSFDLEAICKQVRASKKSRYLDKVSVGARILRVFLAPVAYRAHSTGIVVLIEDVTEEQVLNRSRDEFFSIASHELRTPLTAIRGNASMVLEFYAAELKDPSLRQMVQDIHQSSVGLIEIVNDFLDVSRIEQGKISFDYAEVAIDEVIEKVMYEMGSVLDEKHLHLTFNHKTLGVLPKVWTDQNRLKQIVYNLIGNAAKFTEKGGIAIHAVVEHDNVKVLISDTGRGIALENQKLLFHKFQQANTSLLTRDTTKGTGLGLYISKMLVKKMGGELKLESSQLGKGSTFSFTVPIVSDKNKKTEQKAHIDSATGQTVPAA
ncbi:MAG: hypothetical protein JWM81_1169 [Candidatus Saccharibacteria bacterium]|nr:hypothetical protein [Candidatus Saccharibacteria bacterium]